METLLTILLGTPPHGPVVSVSKSPKIKLREIASDIAKSRIPERFKLLNGTQEVTNFDEWLCMKMFGSLVVNTDAWDEIVKYVTTESDVFHANSSFVAYKHGCMLGHEATQLQMEQENGRWQNLMPFEMPISWVNCEMKSDRIEAITIGTEELDQDNDIAIIFFSAMLVDAIKSAVLSRMQGIATSVLKLPVNLNIKNQAPKSFVMRAG